MAKIKVSKTPKPAVYPFRIAANDPAKKGKLAERKCLFGLDCRYAVAPVHSRFDALGWFVWDSQTQDEETYGPADPKMGVTHPAVIRISKTFEEAISGLC
jgi:hypothetical protein